MKKFLLTLVALSGFAVSAAHAADWLTDYAKALEEAKAQNKVILLDFTGSDWCGWCVKMKEETLNLPKFKHYAKQNLVLVEVDFPNNKPQSAKEKKQNSELKTKFGVSGFPTFVLIDKDEKELGRQEGYLEGGPDAFIKKLNTFYTPKDAKTSAEDEFRKRFKKPEPNPAP